MNRAQLQKLYPQVRSFTEALCEPLAIEDYVVQSMPDASPVKWHLAHTSWFFETFVLKPAVPSYRPFDERYAYLFNSYYYGAGERHPQPQRGLLSRPTVAQVLDYRRHVDGAMRRFLEDAPERALSERSFVIEVGLNHEEQHQELILTDFKHVLAQNPLAPAYRPAPEPAAGARVPLEWLAYAGGLVALGHQGPGFAFDNERPRHHVFLAPFALASRPVTCAEYEAFLADGGYQRPDVWLSDGWNVRERAGLSAPLYWQHDGTRWLEKTLGGLRPVDPRAPVCHVSYYEADAYARWAGARLPLEGEWELVASSAPVRGNFAEAGLFQPAPTEPGRGPLQLFGDVWEWTASPYLPYPGYEPFPDALGEYNGKFMSGRMVLRGGSCATPTRHIRASYRNFFPLDARWQFSGIRLARAAD